MQKKVIIIFSVVGVLLVLAAGVWYLKMKSGNAEIVSPNSAETSKLPTAAPKLLAWNDPAGFTFQYNGILKIDNHPEDKVNYANLEIKEPGKEGKILILASDTKYKDVSEWVAKDANLKGGNVVDITLGGKAAKKISLADSSKVIIGAIDDKILFTIELNSTSDTTIVSSFKFVYPTSAPKTPAGGSSSTGSDIIEEEEIIE